MSRGKRLTCATFVLGNVVGSCVKGKRLTRVVGSCVKGFRQCGGQLCQGVRG